MVFLGRFSCNVEIVRVNLHDILSRFLRYVPVVYVDYPGAISLTQIYGTFNRAMLRLVPSLRSSAQQLTDAMVEFYTMSQVLLNLLPVTQHKLTHIGIPLNTCT